MACKRVELLAESTRSAFNRKREMPGALAEVVRGVDAEVLVLSYNDESWLDRDELDALCRVRGDVRVLAFEQARYVGARIGIHGPDGSRVGEVSHTRNREYVVLAGDRARIGRMVAGMEVAAVEGLQD